MFKRAVRAAPFLSACRPADVPRSLERPARHWFRDRRWRLRLAAVLGLRLALPVERIRTTRAGLRLGSRISDPLVLKAGDRRAPRQSGSRRACAARRSSSASRTVARRWRSHGLSTQEKNVPWASRSVADADNTTRGHYCPVNW